MDLVEATITKTDQQTFLAMLARANFSPDETYPHDTGGITYVFSEGGSKYYACVRFNADGNLKIIFGNRD